MKLRSALDNGHFCLEKTIPRKSAMVKALKRMALQKVMEIYEIEPEDIYSKGERRFGWKQGSLSYVGYVTVGE